MHPVCSIKEYQFDQVTQVLFSQFRRGGGQQQENEGRLNKSSTTLVVWTNEKTQQHSDVFRHRWRISGIETQKEVAGYLNFAKRCV
jgi:hypothetical protein